MDKYKIIDKMLSEPIPDYTYEEAKAFLYELGIIDKDGNVKDVFKPYITERKDNKDYLLKGFEPCDAKLEKF